MQIQKTKPGYKLVKFLFRKYEEIPEEWELIDLNKHTIIKDGNWILEENYSNDGVRLLQIGDIGIGSFLDKSKKFISEKTCKDLKCTIIEQGKDVLISRMPDPIGRSCISPILPYQYIVAVDISILKPDTKKFDTHYLIHTLNNSTNLNNVRKYVAGTTRQRISRKNLESLPILFPHLPEQKKIASILSNVDDLINKHDSLIESTKRLKIGLMRQLLTKGIGHKEFKKVKWYYGKEIEIPNTWKMERLSNIAKIQRGAFTHRPRDEPKFYGGKYPFIQIGDVEKSDGYISKFSQTLNELGLSISKLFPKDCILLSIIANIGSTAITTFPVCMNDNLVGITSEQMNINFLRMVLNARKPYLNNIAPQSAQKSINLEVLKPLLIPIPPIDEQNKIGKIIKTVELRISEIKTKKNYLLELKKGLVQKLLTGQIRV